MSDESRESRRRGQRKGGLAAKANLLSPHAVLLKREGWKYERLREVLRERAHVFEYPVGKFVFDLALLDTKTLVEFDGPYHGAVDQIARDKEKDLAAIAAGFSVVRRAVAPGKVVGPEAVHGL